MAAIFYGWNRAIPGREHHTVEHFAEWVSYLNKQKASSTISDFEIVFLRPHGGDMNGFTLIRGDVQKLHQLVETSEWIEHYMRALHELEGAGYVFADTGVDVQKRMEQWTKAIPTK